MQCARAFADLKTHLICFVQEGNAPGQQLCVDAVTTITLAHNASVVAAQQGDTKQAMSWAGIRDTLSEIYSTLLNNSNKTLGERTLIGSSVGTAEGFVDLGEGIHQLIKDPEKSFHNLGYMAVKLTDYLGDLCVLDSRSN